MTVHQQFTDPRDVMRFSKSSPVLARQLHGGVGACFVELVCARGWRGEPRHLLNALPHLENIDNIHSLRGALANLNFATRPVRTTTADIPRSDLPCLFEKNNGDITVVTERMGDDINYYDGAAGGWKSGPANGAVGTAYFIVNGDGSNGGELDGKDENKRWTSIFLGKFRSLIAGLFAATFFVNLLALVLAVLAMPVYEYVIATRSPDLLVQLMVGALLVIVAQFTLRLLRARSLAYLASRCDIVLGANVIRQMLNLPLSGAGECGIATRISQLKHLDDIGKTVASPSTVALLDLAFIPVFLLAIMAIGGDIAWVPFAVVFLYLILGACALFGAARHTGSAQAAGSRFGDFVMEMSSKHRAIRENTAEPLWIERSEPFVKDQVYRNFRSRVHAMWVQNISHFLALGAGLATLFAGIFAVLDGDMTVGALIAVMALVWHIMVPFQTIFSDLNHFGEVWQSLGQVNQMMRTPIEHRSGRLPTFFREFGGDIALNRVGYRYHPAAEPVLADVTLAIKRGEFVAIAGLNGSGKSTLLKLIMRFYPLNAGTIHIDGIDHRQLDPSELRHSISYLSHDPEFFYGTIDQNMLLANAEANEDDLRTAYRESGLEGYLAQLPEGRETRLTDSFQKTMPESAKQRLALARAYIKNASIYLFDEPANNLDNDGDQLLMLKLAALRGKATILMVTHRPSHMRLADRLICLDNGLVTHDGPSEQVLARMLKPV